MATGSRLKSEVASASGDARAARQVLDALPWQIAALGPDGSISLVNERWLRFAAENDGDPARTGVGTSYVDVCRRAADAGETAAQAVFEGLSGILEGWLDRFCLDYPCPSPTEEHWYGLEAVPLAGGGAVVAHVEVSWRERMAQDLQHQATHDALTGLPNRPLLFDRLDQALKRARRSNSTVAVLFLDLDDFKAVNDACGHLGGDRVLGLVAERLTSQLRAEDTLARFGGDEFVVVAEGVGSRQEAETIARALTGALVGAFEIDGKAVDVGLSIGIALSTLGDDAQALLERADADMYLRKTDQGRNRYRTRPSS